MAIGLILNFAAAERHRWPLWLPVILGSGSALYFALPAEPGFAMGLAAGFAALLAAMAASFGKKGRMTLALLAALLLGFAAA